MIKCLYLCEGHLPNIDAFALLHDLKDLARKRGIEVSNWKVEDRAEKLATSKVERFAMTDPIIICNDVFIRVNPVDSYHDDWIEYNIVFIPEFEDIIMAMNNSPRNTKTTVTNNNFAFIAMVLNRCKYKYDE